MATDGKIIDHHLALLRKLSATQDAQGVVLAEHGEILQTLTRTLVRIQEDAADTRSIAQNMAAIVGYFADRDKRTLDRMDEIERRLSRVEATH